MVDVLFVNPPSPIKGIVVIRDVDRHGRISLERSIWPQTSLASIAAVVKNAGYSVDMIDAIAYDMSWKKFEQGVTQHAPKYIVSTAISSTIDNDTKVATIAKKIGAKAIFCGAHVTSLPRQTLTSYSDVEYVCTNEPEDSILEWIKTIESRGDLSKVLGIGYKQDGKSIVNQKRPMTRDMNHLPIPLHEILPFKKYNLPFIGPQYTFVFISRGCPYRCIYCRSPVLWNRKVKFRDLELVMEELRYLKRIGIKNVFFHADVFTLNKVWVKKMCEKMIEEKLGLHWICNSRADTVTPELLKLMKQAGCSLIMYGFESTDPTVLKNCKKDYTSDKIYDAVKWTHEAGIKIWAYFIIGLPGETWDSVNKTLEDSLRLPFDIVNFSVAAPYPGTEFFKIAQDNKWLTAEDWTDFDQNYSAVVNQPQFTTEDVLKATKYCFRKWYMRPYAVKKMLGGIKSAQDIITLFKIGYGYVKWIMFKPKEKLPEMRHKGGEKMTHDIKLEYEPEHLAAANVSGQTNAQQQVSKVEP